MRFAIIITLLFMPGIFPDTGNAQPKRYSLQDNPGTYVYISVSGNYYFDQYNLKDQQVGYLMTGVFYTNDMVRRSGNFSPNETDLCIDFLDYINAFSEEYGFYRFERGGLWCDINAFENRKKARRHLIREINSLKKSQLYYQIIPYDD